MAFAGIVSGAYGLAKSTGVFNKVGSWFGGGAKCSDSDIQKAEQIAADLQQYTTRSERSSFLASLGASDIGSSPKQMAGFFVGGIENWGGDCKHKNVGDHHRRFLNRLEGWLRDRKRASQQQSSQSTQQQRANQVSGGNQSTGTQSAGMNQTILYVVIAAILAYVATQ